MVDIYDFPLCCLFLTPTTVYILLVILYYTLCTSLPCPPYCVMIPQLNIRNTPIVIIIILCIETTIYLTGRIA